MEKIEGREQKGCGKPPPSRFCTPRAEVICDPLKKMSAHALFAFADARKRWEEQQAAAGGAGGAALPPAPAPAAAAAAEPEPKFLYELTWGHDAERRTLMRKLSEERAEFLAQQKEARRAFDLAQFMKRVDLAGEHRKARDAFKLKMRADRAARRATAVAEKEAAAAALKIREELVRKLKEAQAAAEAAGIRVALEVEMPAAPAAAAVRRSSPRMPLSQWQKFMKRVGGVLGACGVELIPGNKDVRCLASFCSALYGSEWNHRLDDDVILRMAKLGYAHLPARRDDALRELNKMLSS